MPKFKFLPPLILLLALLLGGCEGSGAAGEDGLIHIVTTTGIIADTASRIAGPHARIEALMGPGVDPHLYKASESDVRRLTGAELILYNGLHLEGKMGDILEKVAKRKPVAEGTKDIPRTRLRQPPECKGQP
ncbi:MAG TPA: zinc ABC transporter substrate-binding protein, partial [Thermoanaerobaculia bacterium]|nr:zinc ABC transporter substrate-binding protein [Thermoanaerobaculia bacterium]